MKRGLIAYLFGNLPNIIISNSTDLGNSVCVAFLDLKKAFDSLYFASELGVSNAALNWLKTI